MLCTQPAACTQRAGRALVYTPPRRLDLKESVYKQPAFARGDIYGG